MHTKSLLLVLSLAACVTPAPAQMIGEIRWVGFNFAPSGWASCDGQLLPIAEYEALFQLVGTTYGGDGQETFALPDLRARAPVHQGTGAGLSTRYLGEQGGTETVTLTQSQAAPHAHTAYGVLGSADKAAPSGAQPARLSTQTGQGVYEDNDQRLYKLNGLPTPMAAGMIGPTGGSQPHDNMAPFMGGHCIMSLYGVFPSPN